MEAVGIHDHGTYKLGRRPPTNKPALMLADVLTGGVPEHPVAADHLTGREYGLYGNDQFGDCGPTSVANLVRLVTAALLGQEVQPSQNDVFDLYRRSGNPNFNPSTDADDNGVDMQTMLGALLKGGIGDGQGNKVKPIAFAKVDVSSDAELDAAVSIFGGVLWGVTLQTAQQSQTDAKPPKWDYQSSATWGGHAILDGDYNEQTQDAEVISWATQVQTTAAFRRHQLDEAWVVIWQWNVDHPAFQTGVDLAALEAAYQALTGRPLPLPPVPPAPSPAPTPPAPPAPGPTPGTGPDPADENLWEAVQHWISERHLSEAKHVVAAIREWAKAKGFI